MPPKKFSKFKPWRKGKSAEKRTGGGKKMSAKNRLRGQRRLLAKLNEKGETAEAVKERIAELEGEVKEHEAKERAKKNSTKYHQVKFIERQKLTRLEKSIQRQLDQLNEQSTNKQQNKNSTVERIAQLQEQLKIVALDQLYVAFYPPDVKYMSLFTNGMNRAVDDERGQKRRKEIWNRIREGLLNDMKKGTYDQNDESSGVERMDEGKLANAKVWVNLDAAKKVLLSMSPDTYPNAPSLLRIALTAAPKPKLKVKTKHEKENSSAVKSVADKRFVLSKEVDGLFNESTTGNDYEEKLAIEEDISSDDSDESSDSSDDSSSDDADPLRSYQGHSNEVVEASSSGEDKAKQTKFSKVANEESSDDSDSSGSEFETATPDIKNNARNSSVQNEEDDASEGSEVDSEDDFFTAEKVSTEEVFAQAEKQQINRHAPNNDHYQTKRSDKSKGFSTQNQTKREFRNFQHRKKRSKLR